jgi:hypothetical protein
MLTFRIGATRKVLVLRMRFLDGGKGALALAYAWVVVRWRGSGIAVGLTCSRRGVDAASVERATGHRGWSLTPCSGVSWPE